MTSFLGYTPVPLAFGTSGLRGLVKDITDLEAYINVKGALRYLLATGNVRAPSSVVVAGDLRPSTDRILRAAVQAIVDCGCSVHNAGKIPTPALAHYAISQGRASVMVSGSHIPFDRNGIKLYKREGEVLKSDEDGIRSEVDRVRAEEYGKTAEQSAFDAHGMLRHPPEPPVVDPAVEEAFVQRYLSCFARGRLAGLRIAVYQHSAVGRDVLVRILRELGADVVSVGRSETFVPIDTENITDDELDRLEQLVRTVETSGAPVDAVASTDGDSDRPLLVAVSPTAGASSGGRRLRFLPGDLLGIVVAEYLAAGAAAVPISANDAVERRMAELGIPLEKTKIGSPYVIAAMDELRRAGRHARIVGWEANGGFLVGSDIDLSNGSTLKALPTRDSMLPIIANLCAAADRHARLGALWSTLPARFGRSGLIDDVPTAVSRALLDRLIVPGAVAEVRFDGDAVRDASRTDQFAALSEPAASAWRRSKRILERFFDGSRGFDDIVRINVLDGVRVYFENGDVAHLRPSGNAPQLRIYANADSQARADRIVELGLSEPDGILRRLQREMPA